MKRIITALLILFINITCLFASVKRPITADDLFSIGRVSDLQNSPDGKWISYSVTYYDMNTNKNNSDIWLLSTNGGEPLQLTTNPKSDYGARWSPCSKKIAFISTRNGCPQILIIYLAGGEAKQLTNISTGAKGIVWSPDGKYIASSSDVSPEPTNAKQESLVKAKIIDSLFFRT